MLSFIEKLKKEKNIVFLSSNNIKNKLIKLTSSFLNDFTFKSYQEFKEDLVGIIDGKVLLENYQEGLTFDILKLKLESNILLSPSLKLNLDLKNFYENKKIYLINYNHNDDLINKLLSNFSNVFDITLSCDNSSIKDLLCFEDYNEEVTYVINDIAKKINLGIKPSDILIYYPNRDYLNKLKEILTIYNIDYQTDEMIYLISFDQTKTFLSFLKDHLNQAKLQNICEAYLKMHNDEILNEIMNAINFLMETDLNQVTYNLISYILRTTSKKQINYQNVITLFSNFDNIFDYNTYIYLLGCANNILFSYAKDIKYLKDEIRIKNGLLTSSKQNENMINQIITFINSYNNIYLSYAKIVNLKEYILNQIIDQIKVNKISKVLDIEEIVSNKMAQLIYQKNRHLYDLYGEKTPNFDKGFNTFNDSHHLFNPEYNGVLNKPDVKLVLSDSKIENYVKCPFKYYLKECLKIKEPLSDSIMLGNIVHYVLQKIVDNIYQNNQDKDMVLTNITLYLKEYLSSINYQTTKKDEIYFTKYIKELQDFAKIIINFMDNSGFKLHKTEETLSINLDDITILTGKIDKSMVYNDYFIVIDYKTGSVDFDWKSLDVGLDLQLPIYLILYSKTYNSKPAGAYLENVYQKKFNVDNKLKLKEYAYQGYTNIENDIHLKIDESPNHQALYNMKKDKSLIDDDFDIIIDFAIKKILDIASQIRQGEFFIKPLFDGKSKVGCAYCNFKDICYARPHMIRKYETHDNLDYLKENDHEI